MFMANVFVVIVYTPLSLLRENVLNMRSVGLFYFAFILCVCVLSRAKSVPEIVVCSALYYFVYRCLDDKRNIFSI